MRVDANGNRLYPQENPRLVPFVNLRDLPANFLNLRDDFARFAQDVMERLADLNGQAEALQAITYRMADNVVGYGVKSVEQTEKLLEAVGALRQRDGAQNRVRPWNELPVLAVGTTIVAAVFSYYLIEAGATFAYQSAIKPSVKFVAELLSKDTDTEGELPNQVQAEKAKAQSYIENRRRNH